MAALHQTVNDDATLNSEHEAVQSAAMSEKLLRLERLLSVLDARSIAKKDRARYLADHCGSGISYWSGLLAGDRPFGEKVARRVEDKLGLGRGTLEEHGMAPDTAAIAAAFDAMPTTTPQDIEMRKRIYVSIMGLIAASAPAAPSTPAPGPAEPPTGGPGHRL